jgi:hypothetical protein
VSPRTVAARSLDAAEPSTAEELSSNEAFDRFLPLGRALAEDAILDFRADPQLAYHNLTRGVRNVLAERRRIVSELPMVDLAALGELPQLGQGVIFAALRADVPPRSTGEIGELLKVAYPLRRKLLRAALLLAEDDLIPQGALRKIKKGQGPLNAAHDCVQLAALFERHAARVAGKSSVTEEEVRRAGAVGSRLGTLIRPRGASRRKRRPAEFVQAVEDRNRLWTLLVERHETLWKVGAWLWGRQVDTYVPPLQSRRLPRRPSKTAGTAAATRG